MDSDQRYQLFLDAVKIIRSLADVFEAIANTYRDVNVVEAEANVIEAKEVKELPVEKTVTLEDVRAVLAVKSQNGMTADVKALITKYGGNKLSEVDSKHYADLIKDAEVLGNE